MSTRTSEETTTDDDVVDLTDGSDPSRRGRGADAPRDIPKEGWKDIALRVKDELKRDHVPLLSAGVAFFVLLALFPAFAAMVSIYGLAADPQDVSRQVEDLAGALPESARSLLIDQLESIVSSTGGGLGLALVGGVLVALWSASSGMKHLVAAINVAYDEPETRGFLRLRGLSLLLTVGAILFGVVAIGVLAVLPNVVDDLPLGDTAASAIRIASYPALAVFFGLALAVLYRYGPDRDDPKWRWITPGAAVATVAWIVVSIAFSFYVSNFGSYDETYGSIGAVIVLMLWLALSAFVAILGAEIDSEMEAQTAEDSTIGPERPMGERDAVKADNLGEPEAR